MSYSFKGMCRQANLKYINKLYVGNMIHRDTLLRTHFLFEQIAEGRLDSKTILKKGKQKGTDRLEENE